MLDQLINQSSEFDSRKADHIAPAREFHFNSLAAIEPPAILGGLQSAPLMPDEHALRQLCTKLGPAVWGKGTSKSLPYDYVTTIPADLRSTAFNRHLQDANGSRWMVRGYGNKARAVLSGDYPGGANHDGDFENTQYLKAVHELVTASLPSFPEIRLVRPSVTPDDLNIKVMWKNVQTGTDEGGQYGIGVYIGNGETGSKKLSVLPCLQRTKCDNSIILDSENGLAMVHRGSLAAMRTQFKAAIGRMFQVGAELLDRMIAAEEEQIDDFEMVLGGLAIKHGWRDDISAAVMVGTEGKRTRAGIVNGVTWAAHTRIENPNEQVEMEMLGGSILVAPDTLFATAAKQCRREMAGL